MISDLNTLLIGNAGLQALIGTDDDSTYKVYPVRAKKNATRPYVITRRSAVQPLDFKPAIPSTDDKVSFNIVVYAESYAKGEQISNLIRGLLDGYNGGVFKIIWYTTAEDLFDPEDGSDGSVVINNYYRAWVNQPIT